MNTFSAIVSVIAGSMRLAVVWLMCAGHPSGVLQERNEAGFAVRETGFIFRSG